jgi:uncharacterized protein YuzE
MYIERDEKFDQLYISFGDMVGEGVVAETIEVFPGVYFDVDSGGKLVGIDITNAEEVTGIPVADLSLSGELVGVKEAAALVGKDRANFLRDFASRSDFPKPVVRLASGQLWLSKDIERYMKEQGVATKASTETLRGRE